MPNVCRYDFVKYGDYTFNAFVKTSASIQPVMSDDGYTVKYDRVTFQCEFILNHETVDIDDPLGGGVDLQMDDVRRTLTTSGLNLYVSYRGLGSHSTTTGGSGIDVLKDVVESSLLEGPFPELLDWEPIVGNQAVRCVWKVSYIKQRCEYHYVNQKITNSTYQVRDLLQSLTEEQELSFNESGALTITLTGFIEFAGLQTRNKQTNENTSYPPTTRQALRHLVDMFETIVPLGFQRKAKYKFLKDSRTVTYTITDTEIESDNAFFPYIVKADVTHEVSSSLMGDSVVGSKGFLQWMNSFDGTFHVRPGVWKGWAWIAFSVYLFNRRDRAPALIPAVKEKAKNEKDGATKNPESDEKSKDQEVKTHQLPISIRIKEHILSRQVDISMKYLVTCTMRQLFDATGLFYPVDTLWKKKKVIFQVENNDPSITNLDTVFPDDIGTTPISPVQGIVDKSADPLPITDQWSWFRTMSQQGLQNIYGYRGLQLPNSTLLYDPCNSIAQTYATNDLNAHGAPNIQEQYRPVDNSLSRFEATGYTIPGQGFIGTEDDQDKPVGRYQQSQYLSTLKPSNSWITFNDSITLVENTNASLLPSIEPVGNGHLLAATSSNLSAYDRNKTGFKINGVTGGFPENRYSNHKAMAYGLPSYYVRSTGYALRAGYGIQCPAILGVYKQVTDPTKIDDANNLIQATRVGVNKWTHKQVAQSADIPVYMAMWDVTYVLQGDPTKDNIVYSRNTPSKYT